MRAAKAVSDFAGAEEAFHPPAPHRASFTRHANANFDRLMSPAHPCGGNDPAFTRRACRSEIDMPANKVYISPCAPRNQQDNRGMLRV
jgi:hypothetical protein